MSVVAIIPARFGSTRFPGKPLALLGGKPMIQHVYERASMAKMPDAVVVATDDSRIADMVRSFGGDVVMTSPAHKTGTDRLAEAARSTSASLIVNVQGDLPFFPASMIDDAIVKLETTPDAAIATVRTPIRTSGELTNPNVVKVVTDQNGFALYFSRSPIPFRRDAPEQGVTNKHILWYRHVGMYVYRRDFLFRFATLAPTPLEDTEKLEQLRIMEHGYKICLTQTELLTIEVDTPEDLLRAEETLP